MEQVEGGTLADRLSRRRRSRDRSEALRLLGQLCEGLGHAHRRSSSTATSSRRTCFAGLRRLPQDHGLRDRPRRRGDDSPDRPGRSSAPTATWPPSSSRTGRSLRPPTSTRAGWWPTKCCRTRGARAQRDRRALPAGGSGRTLRGRERAGRGPRHSRWQRCRWRRPPDPVAVQPHEAPPENGRATARWPAPSGRRRWTRLAAGLALIGAIAAGAVIALDSGGSDSPSKPKQSRPTPAPAASVPRSGDPAQQARELADFLRAQSRPGQATAQA